MYLQVLAVVMRGGGGNPPLSNSIRYNREGCCDLPILAVLTPINFIQKQNYKIKYSFPGGGGWGCFFSFLHPVGSPPGSYCLVGDNENADR